mmetsp:Transcript_9793/g.17816  ORF Transcript_9793/g.17816 Transcript_9793/m.17816 type:complete len:391 (-) Transcript_9793:136-1308(-)
MVGTRNGASYVVNDTDRGRLFFQKRKLAKNRKAAADGKIKITRTTEKLVSTPPELKRKREEIEEEKTSKKSNKVTGNVTRSSGIRPRCTDYGRYRCALFKRHGFFFCAPCDLYDTSHQLYARPPSVKAVDTSESDSSDEGSSDEESSDDEEIFGKQKRDSPFSPFATTQRILASEFSPYDEEPVPALADSDQMLNPQIAELMAEVDTLKSEVDTLKSELEKEKQKKKSKGNVTVQEDEPPKEKKKRLTKSVVNANLVEALHEAISNVLNKVPQFKNLGGKRVTQALVAVFWTYDGGIAQEGLIAKVSRWLRDNVFQLGLLLKAMDLRGGVLNYEGLEILRSLEVLGRRFFRNSILPSTSRRSGENRIRKSRSFGGRHEHVQEDQDYGGWH